MTGLLANLLRHEDESGVAGLSGGAVDIPNPQTIRPWRIVFLVANWKVGKLGIVDYRQEYSD